MAHILDRDDLGTRSGWCCPGCGRCYGPQVDTCGQCPVRAGGDDCPVPLDAYGFPDYDARPVIPAIFVPTRDVPGVSPGRLADLQHVLNAATIPFDGLVDGKFVPLPPGAKILPAHPGPGWIKVPDQMTGSHECQRIARVDRTWSEILPGLQCYVRNPAPGDGVTICLRLTPAGDDPGPIEMGR